MSSNVYHVKTQDDLDKQLAEAGDKLVVIDFFATWCGPCKMIAPKFEQMSGELSDVVFLKVDVDECEDIAQKYKVTSMPTFVFIKCKQIVDEFSSANEGKIKEVINKHK